MMDILLLIIACLLLLVAWLLAEQHRFPYLTTKDETKKKAISQSEEKKSCPESSAPFTLVGKSKPRVPQQGTATHAEAENLSERHSTATFAPSNDSGEIFPEGDQVDEREVEQEELAGVFQQPIEVSEESMTIRELTSLRHSTRSDLDEEEQAGLSTAIEKTQGTLLFEQFCERFASHEAVQRQLHHLQASPSERTDTDQGDNDWLSKL